jgi:hypothetical protein
VRNGLKKDGVGVVGWRERVLALSERQKSLLIEKTCRRRLWLQNHPMIWGYAAEAPDDKSASKEALADIARSRNACR